MARQQPTGKLATIFGGSGFVGRYVTRELASRGWRVRAACRRPDLAGYLQPMGAVGQVFPVQANLRYPDSVARAVAGADAVVNAVGILAPSGRQDFEAIHVKGPRAIAKAAREAGIGRFVHISAIGASEKSPADYAKTKAEGEAAVLEEYPGAIILRPSIIFGPEDEFFNRFAGMARVSPILPLIGGGKTRFQPVYVGDVATAVANCVEGSGVTGETYELGGPETLTFKQLLDRTKTWAGHSPAYVSLPFWLAKLQAVFTWPLPNFLRPVTVDQVRLLQVDNVVSDAARNGHRTIAELGVPSPHTVSTIVPEYLERFKSRGQFAHYRG